ncbi:MAG: EAL domain-containing protein [Burkholderiaceae bacterium]
MAVSALSATAGPLLYDADDGFVELAADGTVREWNAHAAALFGWSAAEAGGRDLAELLLAPAARPPWRDGLRQCLDAGHRQVQKKRIELTARHKDGRDQPAEFTLTLMRLNEHVSFTVSIRDISLKRAAERTLRERTALLNLSHEAIVAADMEDRILFWNAGAERMYGYLAEEAVGRPWPERLVPASAAALAEIRRELELRGCWEGELRQMRRDGAELTALCRWLIERDGGGRPVRLLMASAEAGATMQMLETTTRLQESEQRFKSLFEHHSDGVFSFNPLAQLTAVNMALCALTGYSRDELLTMPLSPLVARRSLPEVRSCFLEALQGKPQTCDLVFVKKDGTPFDVSIVILPNIIDGSVAGLHGIVKDVSHHKQSERRIRHLANHDALTGLPNRNLLEERIKHAIEQARRGESRIGVLLMDLNRFKIINDSLGHANGDLLLRAVAARLQAAVRDADTVARLGGDEFVVLLENIREFEQISHVADNLLKAVRQPLEISGHVLSISTSIGASIFPDDGADAATLFKNADLAMYEAKAAGDGMFRLYDAEMNARAVMRLHSENSLRQALERAQFVIHYQPRLDLASNAVVGVEALARWNHPDKGLVFPANFIPLAEEIGLIDALGEWVLLAACRQLKAWQDQRLPPLMMSVNLSTLQLGSGRIREILHGVLAEAALDPRFLELEITESSLMRDLDACARMLEDIRELGVSLSIDDFGTGYSSLAYLKRLPINALKIDKSFVRDIPHDTDDAAIVSATIAMAHSMGLRVVAEGVTSYEQRRFLEACRCDEIQGYLLCQPLPADELALFLRTSELRGLATRPPESPAR